MQRHVVTALSIALVGASLSIGLFGRANAESMIGYKYVDGDVPGNTPVVFGKGVVSTADHRELNAVFSPDGLEFYFLRQVRGAYKTFVMRRDATGRWSGPEIASFSRTNDQWDEVDIWLSDNGATAYFISNRPAAGFAAGSVNIWRVSRGGDGWSVPELLPRPINSNANVIYPVTTTSGALYFTSSRPEDDGNRDVYKAQTSQGAGWGIEVVGEPVSTPAREGDVYVSTDERVMILTSEREGGEGGADLYFSSRCKGETWSEPVNLAQPINSPGHDYAPVFSPDGLYFFFTRDGDIYWVSSTAIGDPLRSDPCIAG